MSKAPTVSPEAESQDPKDILLLPGYAFFVDRIALPEALESSEIEDFAELSLEGAAPFPIEHLYWGFLHNTDEGVIILYASPKDRLKALGYSGLEEYKWVLPDFAVLTGAHFPEDLNVILEHSEAANQIYFKKGAALPFEVTSKPSLSEIPGTENSFRILLEQIHIGEKDIPTFHFNAVDESDADTPGNWKTITPTESALWCADVRATTFKQATRNNRRLSALAIRITKYAAIFAIVLVLLEGLLFAGKLWLDTLKDKTLVQAPEVSRIQEKQSLMLKLNQVAQNELRPIDMLRVLNKVRPQGLYFTGTTTEGNNRITIDGEANSVSELDDYLKQILQSGLFQIVEEKSSTKRGKTIFEVVLDYDHDAQIIATEPEATEANEG